MGSVSQMQPQQDNTGQKDKSGTGMDRVIETRAINRKKILMGGLGFLLVAALVWAVQNQPSGTSLKVQSDRVAISQVTMGIFEDFIPIRGRATPARTVYLDAIEGGRVEKVHVEDGAVVKAGDLIVTLSNTSLLLDVTRNEALVTEQLNALRTLELQLEQNRLTHKRNLNEFNYNIRRLTRQVDRQRELAGREIVAQSVLEDSEDELAYNIARSDLTLESQKTDARLQEQQLVYLKESADQLRTNLAISRDNLASLNVRAPVEGKVSGFDVEVGQSIDRGGRLGQVDDPSTFKLAADIDEFYLGRIDIGQTASFERGGRRYQLQVSKIYPQVTNGQFRIDLLFVDGQADTRRGQTLQMKLTLGSSEEAVLIPNGAFYQDTGGSWIFVVSGDVAVRRTVRLGRRNSRYIEVLEGLEVGETIITSPYSGYLQMDQLKLT